MKKMLCLLILISISFAGRKDDLQNEIEEMKKKIDREKQFFDDYENRRTGLILSKKKEIKRLDKDIKENRGALSRIKSEIKKNEIQIKNYILEATEIKKKLRVISVDIKNSVLNGIPFDVQRRAAILTSIISDIDADVGSPVEILNRLVAFFDAEDVYSYDSQTFSAIISIGGKDANVTVLRIGRILFFVDDGKEVYSYIKKDGVYKVDEENPLSIEKKRKIRDAIGMLNGQKPMDIVDLDIYIKKNN